MMQKIQLVHICALTALLCGCSTGPQYEPPGIEETCSWHSPLSAGMHQAPVDTFLWWEALDDPTLNSLITRASLQNLDLKIAATRVLQARGYHRGKKGDLYPHIDASVSAGHLYYSKDALLNGVLAGSKPCGHIHRNVNFFELGFDAEWEIDIFGATRHELNALAALSEAEEEAFCGGWITLSAEIAKNYVVLRDLQKQRALAQQQIDAQQEIASVTAGLVEAGLASAEEALVAKQQLDQLSAEVPPIELDIDKAIHRLSILLGLAPGELCDELACAQACPLVPADMPVGIPSELLRRRPDIRKAERELAAAAEYVDSAVAALFPRFSMRGFIGDISTQLPSLTGPASGTWLLQPQLLMPIFNSRLLQEDVKDKRLKAQATCHQYQKTVLEALEEAENAIAALHHEQARQRLLQEALNSAEAARALVADLYRRGLKSYIDVLAADRALLTAQALYNESQLALLLHYIALYKALG